MNWIALNGGATRYVLEGSGPRALVLIHEMGGAIESWEPLLPHLGDGARVLRYDMRGFGDATKLGGTGAMAGLVDDLFALLDALGIAEPVDLCGMAVGGAVAAFAGARRPDRVASLGLMGPALGVAPERRDALRARADAIEANGMAWLAPSELGLTYPPELRGNGRFEAYRARWLGNDPSSYAATCRMLAGLEAAEALAAIRAPALLIAGALDPLRPPALIAAAAGQIPGARFAAVPGGHVMAHQSPEAVAAALKAFWGRP